MRDARLASSSPPVENTEAGRWMAVLQLPIQETSPGCLYSSEPKALHPPSLRLWTYFQDSVGAVTPAISLSRYMGDSPECEVSTVVSPCEGCFTDRRRRSSCGKLSLPSGALAPSMIPVSSRLLIAHDGEALLPKKAPQPSTHGFRRPIF